jgi:hypothetical protein
MMNQHYGDLLPFYVIGQVSPQERADIETHLSECPRCRHEYEMWCLVPEVSAMLQVAPSSNPNGDNTWNMLVLRMSEQASPIRRTQSMSFDQLPASSPRMNMSHANRPNTWVAIVAVVGIITLLGVFLAVFRGHGAPTQPGKSHSAVPTATDVPSYRVTQADAEALFHSFLIACQQPDTFSHAGQGVPCAKADMGRLPSLHSVTAPHYCADDWHLVSIFYLDTTEARVQALHTVITLDATETFDTTKLPIQPVDPTYSQQHFGGQYWYSQEGEVLPPFAINPGAHTLRLYDRDGGSFNRFYPFTIDASGTGVCKPQA